MRTVRRLYFYLVAFISLQVVVWGVVSLGRTLAEDLPGGGAVDLLASGLSLALVGLPIFMIHWLVVQRDARQDDEERSTRLRALFLYGVLFAALAPVVYALLAIISRGAFDLFNLATSRALVGAGQTFADNFIAIVVNLVAWFYFQRLLRQEWGAGINDRFLREMRRLYRYAWVVYGLVLLITGMQQVLTFLFNLANRQPVGLLEVTLANGLAFSLVGAPLWAAAWSNVQKCLDETGERLSALRVGFLYLASIIGCFTALAAAGTLLADLLEVLFGRPYRLLNLVEDNSTTLAILIPFAVLWAYHARAWQAACADEADPLQRDGRQRLYFYLLSLAGTVVTFVGLIRLGSNIIEMAFSNLFVAALRADLAVSLALLAVGLPLWLIPWRKMQDGAQQSGDAGDHARRSLLRKGVLYLILFASVVGAMAAAGWALYLVLSQVLGSPTPDFWHEFSNRLQIFAWVLAWLGYHWNVLRSDGRRAQQALSQRHAAYPVLLLQEEADDGFSETLAGVLRRQMPRLPIRMHKPGETAFDDDEMQNALLVVLPAALALEPPEALRQWLGKFPGQRLVAPTPIQRWTLLDSSQRPLEDLAKDMAAAIRQLAEGQALRAPRKASPWLIAGAAVGGFFLLVALFGFSMSLISSF